MVRSNEIFRDLGLLCGAFLLGILCLAGLTALAWIPGIAMPVRVVAFLLIYALVAFWPIAQFPPHMQQEDLNVACHDLAR